MFSDVIRNGGIQLAIGSAKAIDWVRSGTRRWEALICLGLRPRLRAHTLATEAISGLRDTGLVALVPGDVQFWFGGVLKGPIGTYFDDQT
jgi:hypothetical protein